MLISDEYRRLNADLHAREQFGRRGGRHADAVLKLWQHHGPCTILDYGCGAGGLSKALHDLPVRNYDPAVAEYAALPASAGIVVCTDVLEHIEPACLDEVLLHIARLTDIIAYFVIATELDGGKRLADGRDPHLIVNPARWWLSRMQDYMRCEMIATGRRDCTILAYPGD